jgi:arabinan endo-1,5-alpha-L-arabinosidase
MKTYTNPVWPGYFADPFVLKSGRDYWAYGTGPGADGREIPVLHSTDLVHWESKGAALVPPEHLVGGNFWAPEVAEKDGSFFMYFSGEAKGNDAFQRLRVAVSKNPAGPFMDSGKMLMPDGGFSIDAHPFKDPKDGKWYLFFALDYTNEEPFGTGLAVVPLTDDLMNVVGSPRLVVRASSDWQIYERNRDYKGRIWPAWNCVEGPFVVYHAGKYYCFYSGGAWHTENYGLGFAVADNPLGPWKDEFAAKGPTVLKGIPGKVLGPGHNSVVMGPDGRTQYCVYHAWDLNRSARRMCIDPIVWTKDGPKCDGPSFEARTIES